MRACGTWLALPVLLACGSMDSEVRLDSSGRQDSGVPAPSGVNRHVLTDTSIAGIRIGMTLDSVRRLHPRAQFERSEDADGAGFIGIMLDADSRVNAAIDEERATDAIDYSRRVTYLETFDSTFVSADGVRVGSLITDVERLLGPVKEIIESEIESRQFVEFERQPATMVFRLDYTGIFPAGSRRTTRHEPGASVFSVAIVPP